MRIKEPKEIAQYLKEQIEKQGFKKQADLADKMLEISQDINFPEPPFSKMQLTDNISKWLKGTRYPGTEYLFYLSRALKVTIENILTAGECNEKYDDRITLYAIGKDKELNLINMFEDFCEKKYKSEDPYDVFINYDEYNKTLIDYAVEFRNINLIKYLFNNHYIDINNYRFSTQFREFNDPHLMTKEILDIIIENDEIEYFEKMINRACILNRNPEYDYKHKEIEDTVIEKVFTAPKIFEYLTTEFIYNDDEWNWYNRGIYPKQQIVKELPNLSGWYNELLRVSIQKGYYDISLKLIAKGIEHNNKVASLLKELPYKYYIDKDNCLKGRIGYWDCTNMLIGYNANFIPDNLKEKIDELNNSLEKCGIRPKKTLV